MSKKTFFLKEESIMNFFQIHANTPVDQKDKFGSPGKPFSPYVCGNYIHVKKTCPVNVGELLSIIYDSYEQVSDTKVEVSVTFECHYYDNHSNVLKLASVKCEAYTKHA